MRTVHTDDTVQSPATVSLSAFAFCHLLSGLPPTPGLQSLLMRHSSLAPIGRMEPAVLGA